MNNPRPSSCKDNPLRCGSRTSGRARKNFWCFITRNPLKRQDSGERIQEIQDNPTLINGAFAVRWPRAKKTQIDRMSVRLSARERNRTGSLPMQKRASVIGASGLRRLDVIEGAVRRLLGRQTNWSRIIERPLGAGMEFGPAWRHDSVRGCNAHRGTRRRRADCRHDS